MSSHQPPKTLSKAAATLWREYYEQFDLKDVHGLTLLTSAMQAFNQLQDAQEDIREHGLTFAGPKGERKANPACAIARDARAQMLSSLKALHLDVLPQGKPGAPQRGR